MQPHRPAYDAHADKASAGQRHIDMRDSLVGSSDRRLPRMQASGLPHGHMEPDSGFGHGSSQRFRPTSPLLSPTSTRAAAPVPSRAAAVADQEYRSMPPTARYLAPDHARLPQPRSHQDRLYDGYQSLHPDSRIRGEHVDRRSPRYAAAPLPSSSYDGTADARHLHSHQQPQQRPRYPEYDYPRHVDAGAVQSQPFLPHSAYTHRDARTDDRSRAPLRTPHHSDGYVERISPSNEFDNHRTSFSSDHADRSDYRPPHDARYMSDPRRDSAGVSRPPASTSSHPGGHTSMAIRTAPVSSRKRKKQFKYMLELDAADSSKSNNAATNEEEHDRDHFDQLEAGQEADGASQRKESRKKVKKACVFCKRSHMPCEEARPCKRCVKRGISHLCRDAEPANASSGASTSGQAAKGKFGEARQHARAKRHKQDGSRRDSRQAGETETESDLESLASSAASTFPHRSGPGGRKHNDINVMPGAAEPDPDMRPSMPVSMLLDSAGAELARRPARRSPSPGVTEEEQKQAWNRSMDPSTQHKMKRMLEAGPAAEDLSDIFGEMPTSLLMTPAMANAPEGQSILRPASADPAGSPKPKNEGELRYKRSLSDPFIGGGGEHCQVDEAGFKLPPRPKHLLQEEMATTSDLRGGPPTYSYTYGYAKLARWMHTRYSRANCEKVDQSLSVIRPKLMALSRSLPEEELIGVEDSFYRLLEFYQTHVLETIPVAMIVARRTGEIYAANAHASKLLQLPSSIFQGGQICHYQLVTEKDAVDMWGKYAQEAERRLDTPPSQVVTLEIDRSLLLFGKAGFNPRTGELLGDSGVCDDGSEVVVRKKAVVTFEAKISKHGLPFMVTGTIVPIPDEDE